MTRQKTLLTADEFYEFCCHNDGRYELVDGEVVEMAPANEQHGAAALNIGGALISTIPVNTASDAPRSKPATSCGAARIRCEAPT